MTIPSQVDLSPMQEVDVRTVDPGTLVDICNVKIDPHLPRDARWESFVTQIKNPYCFTCGKIVIKIRCPQGMDLRTYLMGEEE